MYRVKSRPTNRSHKGFHQPGGGGGRTEIRQLILFPVPLLLLYNSVRPANKVSRRPLSLAATKSELPNVCKIKGIGLEIEGTDGRGRKDQLGNGKELRKGFPFTSKVLVVDKDVGHSLYEKTGSMRWLVSHLRVFTITTAERDLRVPFLTPLHAYTLTSLLLEVVLNISTVRLLINLKDLELNTLASQDSLCILTVTKEKKGLC